MSLATPTPPHATTPASHTPYAKPLPRFAIHKEDRATYRARKRLDSAYEFRTDVIYTFSFNTGVFDLPAWKLHRLPTRDIWLSSFVGDSFLRFVAYEENAGGSHAWRENRYLLCAAVTHTPHAEYAARNGASATH